MAQIACCSVMPLGADFSISCLLNCVSTVGFNRGFLDGGGQGGMPRRRSLQRTIPSVDNEAALQAIGV